jgi:DDE superfamily endonuclease
MAWCKAFLPIPLPAFCAHTNSNRGGIISGFRRTFPVISTLRNRSATWWISTHVHSLMKRWCCVPTKRPICSLVLVWRSTLPTQPGHPTRLEQGYKRAGALHLFAAFDTPTGKVYARTAVRKRQKEFIALLTQLDEGIPSSIRCIWLVLDNLSVHKGKQVQTWLQSHPRFVCWFLTVHCSWMNQVE